MNESALYITTPLSNPSCKSSNIIDANTEEDTSYANLPAFDDDGIKKIVLLKSIESLSNTAL